MLPGGGSGGAANTPISTPPAQFRRATLPGALTLDQLRSTLALTDLQARKIGAIMQTYTREHEVSGGSAAEMMRLHGQVVSVLDSRQAARLGKMLGVNMCNGRCKGH